MYEVPKVQRVNGLSGDVLVVKSGVLSMQLDEEQAKSLCRTLGMWLGLSVDDKEKIQILKNKANTRSTKKKPLGV